MRQLDLQKSGSLVRVTLQRSGDILNLNSLVVEMVHFSSTADVWVIFQSRVWWGGAK